MWSPGPQQVGDVLRFRPDRWRRRVPRRRPPTRRRHLQRRARWVVRCGRTRIPCGRHLFLHEGAGLVDRRDDRAGGWIGFLPGMNGARLEAGIRPTVMRLLPLRSKRHRAASFPMLKSMMAVAPGCAYARSRRCLRGARSLMGDKSSRSARVRRRPALPVATARAPRARRKQAREDPLDLLVGVDQREGPVHHGADLGAERVGVAEELIEQTCAPGPNPRRSALRRAPGRRLTRPAVCRADDRELRDVMLAQQLDGVAPRSGRSSRRRPSGSRRSARRRPFLRGPAA